MSRGVCQGECVKGSVSRGVCQEECVMKSTRLFLITCNSLSHLNAPNLNCSHTCMWKVPWMLLLSTEGT